MIEPKWRKASDIQVIESTACEVGKPLLGFDGGYKGYASTLIFAHPLDVIAMEYATDPLTRLEKAMEWIVNEAHHKLDLIYVQLILDTANETR